MSDRERAARGFYDGSSAVIACWCYLQAKPTSAARRALFEAVNDLWATRVLQWETR